MRVGGHFVTCIGLRAGVPDGHKLDSVPTVGRAARSFKEVCERPQTLRKIFFRQRSQLGRKQTAVKARAKRSDVTSVESWKANRWR